jgi:hypothetical protein
MKVLFLDIDGVLATEKCFGKFEYFDHMRAYRFDPDCVKQLERIVESTGCQIVLSSDWKHHYSLSQMQYFFQDVNACRFVPIEFTPSFSAIEMSEGYDSIRNREILHYVEEKQIEKWCAVDDMPLTLPYFVRCYDSDYGLTEEKANEIIEKLNS